MRRCKTWFWVESNIHCNIQSVHEISFCQRHLWRPLIGMGWAATIGPLMNTCLWLVLILSKRLSKIEWCEQGLPPLLHQKRFGHLYTPKREIRHSGGVRWLDAPAWIWFARYDKEVIRLFIRRNERYMRGDGRTNGLQQNTTITAMWLQCNVVCSAGNDCTQQEGVIQTYTALKYWSLHNNRRAKASTSS